MADRAVQDEALFRLYRAAVVDRQRGQVGAVGADFQVLEQLPQVQLQRPVDDQAERALGVVLADISDRLEKVRIRQRGMAIRNWLVR